MKYALLYLIEPDDPLFETYDSGHVVSVPGAETPREAWQRGQLTAAVHSRCDINRVIPVAVMPVKAADSVRTADDLYPIEPPDQWRRRLPPLSKVIGR